MNDTVLQIIVSLVDQTSAALESVGAHLLGISTDAQAAVQGADAAFSELSATAGTTATSAVESWDQSLADLKEMMASADETVAEGFTGMANDAAGAATEMESSISSVGGKIQAVGIQLGIMGTAIAAPAALAVKSAGDQADAFDQLANTVSNVYASASAPTSGYATEVADLTAKINAQKASIAEADAALGKSTGTTAEVSASHEKASASIATAQVNIQKLQQQLAQLTNGQQLAKGSVADTTSQFEAAARASTTYGFNVSDSANALQFLFASTGNVNQTMSAYQDAMDLAAKKGISLTTASNDVIQGMNGQGRSLRDLGINVADGLSGQTALAAIQEKVSGAAADAATHGLGPYNVAMAKLNEAMADFGTTVLPMLSSFFEWLTKIISAVDQWAQAHPKLAEALLIFLGLLGGLLIVVGAILVPFGLLIIGIEAFTTALEVLGIGMLAAVGWTLLYVAAFVAIVAIVALVIVYHKQIMDAIEAAWNWIVAFVTDHWEAIVNILFPGMGTLVAFLFSHWGTIKSDVEDAWDWIENFIEGIWKKIVTTAQAALATVESLISKIMAPIDAVTGAVAGITGGIGNVVGGAIKAFASGGIVSSPTLALVGEAGPEAIIPLSAFSGGSSLAGNAGGAAGSINVYIQGGTYLDQGGASMIANALATQIGRQLKLRNYY